MLSGGGNKSANVGPLSTWRVGGLSKLLFYRLISLINPNWDPF